MPMVDFLTDEEAMAYGRYTGPPSRTDLERVFFLDDEDRVLVDRHRGEHMRLGFSLQLVTVRWVGTFLEDPLDVPGVVLDFVAERLGIADNDQGAGPGRRGDGAGHGRARGGGAGAAPQVGGAGQLRPVHHGIGVLEASTEGPL
ncbi:DUF4158 domain-containing protein [Spirillospora sp. NPDC048911]|uniref:DUF4158 domain-containing protein n=1 Tax=Spirillospora sp. NPDC048911 TaxID=3364527 RepID=UPI0037102180